MSFPLPPLFTTAALAGSAEPLVRAATSSAEDNQAMQGARSFSDEVEASVTLGHAVFVPSRLRFGHRNDRLQPLRDRLKGAETRIRILSTPLRIDAPWSCRSFTSCSVVSSARTRIKGGVVSEVPKAEAVDPFEVGRAVDRILRATMTLCPQRSGCPWVNRLRPRQTAEGRFGRINRCPGRGEECGCWERFSRSSSSASLAVWRYLNGRFESFVMRMSSLSGQRTNCETKQRPRQSTRRSGTNGRISSRAGRRPSVGAQADSKEAPAQHSGFDPQS